MASIPTAFHLFEKREMNVSEYESYLRQHRFQMSIRAIKCVECGDFLIYCNGDFNAPYFKHAPSHEGHSYCSLYREGKESKTNESLIRKRFFHEEDISLNFELFYKNGSWKSLITIPPFKSSEIEDNERNETTINIVEINKFISIPIDNGHFQAGEIKKVPLKRISDRIRIRIEGNSTRNNISYDMEGFIPNNQLYASLIVQKYSSNTGQNYIDLRNINSFICKRISGYVYTGRHYLIFSYNPNFELKYKHYKSIEIKRINLVSDKMFNYYLFDIVFNKVDDSSIEFCNSRNCMITEKDDAVILWPPIVTVGNYRYYGHNKTKMYISFENQSKSLELKEYYLCNDKSRMRTFFKIQDLHSNSYYVTLDNRKIAKKESMRITNTSVENLDYTLYEKYYYLNHDIVFSNKQDPRTRLSKKSQIILLNNQLDRIFATNDSDDSIVNNDLLFYAIRYTSEYITFNPSVYNFLKVKYNNDNFVLEYLEHCNRVGTIKRKALELIIGEKH